MVRRNPSSTPELCTSDPVAEKRSYLLRIDAEVLDALQRWAADDLRSLNGQLEFLLRQALRQAGRIKERPPPGAARPKEPRRRG